MSYQLKHPVAFGSESITDLDLKPVAKAFRGFSLDTRPDGSFKFEPYAAAAVAVAMSGRPPALTDMLHPEDMMGLATEAISFFGGGLTTGKTS